MAHMSNIYTRQCSGLPFLGMLAAKLSAGVQFYTDSLLQVRHDQPRPKHLRKAPGSRAPVFEVNR
jgi:hypothetical protein